MLVHPIEPVCDSSSKVLILGSFPSVKSREFGFYYGHPQNRFWRVISRVVGCETPMDIESKRAMLLKNGIALWDVVGSCNIEGSADSTITNVTPNDIAEILEKCEIKQIFVNGKKAYELYGKLIEPTVGVKAVCLPSTSPANASCSEDRLYHQWKAALEKYLNSQS